MSAKTRIFIVDDHPLLRRGLAELINREPDMVFCGEAEDSPSALKMISQIKPDLVIVDISLKGYNGIELIKNIKAFDSKIQILVLSMHDESIYAMRVLKAGAKAYVMKQEVVDKVMEAVRRIRAGKVFVSERVASRMLDQVVVGGDPAPDSPVDLLSDRELEIVNMIGSGLPTREIAGKLHISIKTVESHRARIKEKLNLQNAIQLVQFCVRWVEEGAKAL
ncbi:DNA-binding response regulator [Nibricoccus aquaticus]|uniref:DNA-binding response regulator n=1 Tax=Nibricoccus aquaticus TaxID=2576891 RepID=A0A290Q430_9BACT|nr:response regulator transcription factor [Nibricoccus aquaticus]ATC63047.1 DNA-binding response regulator [Nibricoccus aquaticus]